MIRTIIIDDEKMARDNLVKLLTSHCSHEVEIIGEATEINDAYEKIKALRPQLVFLDIDLGAGTAFDLLSKFDGFFFKIIFVTAHDRFAIKAFKFNAVDYLLKPVQVLEVQEAVSRVIQATKSSHDTRLNNLFKFNQQPLNKSNTIAIPTEKGYQMLPVNEILYCTASKEYTNIYHKNGGYLCSAFNLGEYEELLAGYQFFRVHHSYLVNKEHITSYTKGEGGEVVMDNKAIIPVSRRKKAEFLEWLTHK
jgi:two-component system, LytTR family, response regulator